VAEQLVAQARAKGTDPVGPIGLLTRLTKQVCETALEEDILATSRARSNCAATHTGLNELPAAPLDSCIARTPGRSAATAEN
jgi:hypothetical protein